MFTSTLCLLQDQLEASDEAIHSLEGDIPELSNAYPAIAAVRMVQEQYHRLIDAQTKAIDELRKLTPETCCKDKVPTKNLKAEARPFR